MRTCGLHFLFVVYIHPRATDDVYLSWFGKVESFAGSVNGKIITGDLNMHSASVNVTNYYCNFLEYCHFIDRNHFFNWRCSKLDVVLVRECDEPHMIVELVVAGAWLIKLTFTILLLL